MRDPADIRTAPPLVFLHHQAGFFAFFLLILALPWTVAPMGIAAAVCGLLTAWVWFGPSRSGIPGTPVGLAGIAWAVALVLAALFAADVAGSLPRIKKALFPVLVPLAVTWARDPRTGSQAVALLLLSSVAAAAVGLAQVVGRDVGLDLRARGPVGHYMTFAGQLLIFVSLAAGIVFATRRPAWRVGAGLAALAGVAALFGTFTRSAWLGLVVSLAVMLGWRHPRWLVALAVLVALTVLLAPPAYRERLVSAFDPAHATNVERTHMWKAGARMFRDHPLTGVGLQDLKPIYERYKDPDAVEPAGHLHSVPVQIAATMGVAGLVAFAFLYLALAWCAWEGLGRQLDRGGLAAGVRLGMLGALAGFLVAGLFEWNFGDEELLYPLFTLAGLAWAARAWDASGEDRAA
jgi:O-antigen ligase